MQCRRVATARGKDLRSSEGKQQKGEVHGAGEDRHGFIPTEHDKDAVHPVRDLGNAGDGTSLRFDKVGICILAELVGKVQAFCVRKNSERRGKIKVVVGHVIRVFLREGKLKARIDGLDAGVDGDELQRLQSK